LVLELWYSSCRIWEIVEKSGYGMFREKQVGNVKVEGEKGEEGLG
jgi:hypothetical protein